MYFTPESFRIPSNYERLPRNIECDGACPGSGGVALLPIRAAFSFGLPGGIAAKENSENSIEEVSTYRYGVLESTPKFH